MNDLAVLFLQHGLERLLPHMPTLARPSIRLRETEEVGRAGYSRLGGLPDAYPDFRWPRFRDCQLSAQQAETLDLDTPLIFLGQLNWQQLKPFDTANALPTSGGALFFTGLGLGAGTYFVANLDEFAPRHFPLPEHLKYVLPRRLLYPQFEWTLPYYGFHGTIGGGDARKCFFDTLSPGIEFLVLSDAESKAYEQLRANLGQAGSSRHRVLGHPDYEQNPMRLDLECQTRGLVLNYKTYLELYDPQAPLTRQLKQQALDSKWRLAFQVGHFSTDEGLWGDGGTHYFWSKQEDLYSPVPRFIGSGQCG
ncbi:hypothetical protein IAD21_03296 [Abditibacteriota bacterium]|nr:hypothetical protein IAD21_03296 [Abditibacteriota bacterium]